MNHFKNKIILYTLLITLKLTLQKDQKSKHKEDNLRRFLEDLEDEEWHISHLRDTNFEARRSESECKDDTFEGRARRYKEGLKNDGALVEYVSADALVVNEKDLQTDVCKLPKKPKKVVKANKLKSNVTEPKAKTNINKTNEVKTNATADEKGDKKEVVNAATTAKPKEAVKEGVKVENKDEGDIRRANDYLFSSVEYYDEVPDFDNTICPEFVTIIELEIDQLRAYDVECELMIEWRSLE